MGEHLVILGSLLRSACFFRVPSLSTKGTGIADHPVAQSPRNAPVNPPPEQVLSGVSVSSSASRTDGFATSSPQSFSPMHHDDRALNHLRVL